MLSRGGAEDAEELGSPAAVEASSNSGDRCASRNRAEAPSALSAPPREHWLTRLLILLVRGWQIGPSAMMPPSCRFDPSCSAYAITALRRYGAVRGGWLAVKRIARCHPWGKFGPDPVP